MDIKVGDIFSVDTDRWKHVIGDVFNVRWHNKYYVTVETIETTSSNATYKVIKLENLQD